MVLGELSGLKKPQAEQNKLFATKKLGRFIELQKLEVVPCFHVSPVGNRESILTYGIKPMASADGRLIIYGPRIFVSSTYEDAAFDYVNYEQVDVWSFYLQKHLLLPDEYSSYANHYYTEEPIPWYKLTLMETRQELS